jgi:hypothetical protein
MTIREFEAERDRVEAALLVVDENIVNIGNQIDAAEHRRVDSGWLTRCKAARRFKGLERARLQTELARLKRLIRDAEDNGFHAKFKAAVKRHVPTKLYQAIIADALAA